MNYYIIQRLRCSFMLIFCSPADHEADQPTLIECIRFQGKERIINTPQEIGTSYDDFGLLLLDDHNGASIHSIACQHKDDAQ